MHLKSTALLAVALFAAAPLATSAAEKKEATPTPAEAELIAKARATYPLKKCLVSDEDLGSMGDASPYIYHQAGKPDRVVFFCCDGCLDDFKADPAKYLKKVDDAAAAAKHGGQAAAPAKEAKKKHDQ
jgi:YHS domain-containing protein